MIVGKDKKFGFETDFDFQSDYFDGADLDDGADISFGGLPHDSSVDSLFDNPDDFYPEAWQLDEAELSDDAAQTARKADIARIAKLDGRLRGHYAASVSLSALRRLRHSTRKPLIDHAEANNKLIAEMKSGNQSAGWQLVVENLGLAAAKSAGWFPPQHLTKEDLFQAAIAGNQALGGNNRENSGLLRAAKLYQPNRGAQFSTYAGRWIKQAIGRAVQNQDREIRISAHVLERVASADKLKNEIERYSQDLPTGPNELRQAAAALGLDSKVVEKYLILPVADISLDTVDPNRFASEDAGLAKVDDDEEADWLLRELKSSYLGDRRALEILTRLFGLSGGQPETLDEVGQRFGVTREWVRQIRNQALRNARYNKAIEILAPQGQKGLIPEKV